MREEAVARSMVEDLNQRILDLRRRPPEGVPVFVPTVDVEAALQRWRESR